MGSKSEPARRDQVYILGLDRNGNPRGARFSVLRDSIVSAAMETSMGGQIIKEKPLGLRCWKDVT